MKKVEHYLITICVNPALNLHGYVMTDDKRDLMAVADTMVEIAETNGPLRLPVILQTTLDTGTDVVREIVCKYSEEAKQLLATATNYHLSVFEMRADCPDDERLMELH